MRFTNTIKLTSKTSISTLITTSIVITNTIIISKNQMYYSGYAPCNLIKTDNNTVYIDFANNISSVKIYFSYDDEGWLYINDTLYLYGNYGNKTITISNPFINNSNNVISVKIRNYNESCGIEEDHMSFSYILTINTVSK